MGFSAVVVVVKKESPNMGTKTLEKVAMIFSFLPSEKRIPKHGDENTSPLSVYVVNTWLT